MNIALLSTVGGFLSNAVGWGVGELKASACGSNQTYDSNSGTCVDNNSASIGGSGTNTWLIVGGIAIVAVIIFFVVK